MEDPPNFRMTAGKHTPQCYNCAHMKMFREKFTCTKYLCYVLAGTECDSYEYNHGIEGPLDAEVRRMLELRGVREVPGIKGNSARRPLPEGTSRFQVGAGS